MKVRNLFLAVLVLLSINCLADKKRPNIIIVMTDDSGYSDLGCYGGEIETPKLPRLAKQGMRFVNFYTNGRCSPSRASLLTGHASGDVGFGAGTLGGWQREIKMPAYRARLPYHIPTIAELMKEVGYRTMMVGKWHLGGSLMESEIGLQMRWKKQHPGWELTREEIEADYNALPVQRGFEKYFGILEGENNCFITPDDNSTYLEGNKKARLSFDKNYAMTCMANSNSPSHYKNCENKKAKAFYATDGETDRAIEMIREDNSGNPFFLYLAYRVPHLPLQAPHELVEKYMTYYENMSEVEKNRVDGLVREGLFPDSASYKANFSNVKASKQLQKRYALHAAMTEMVDINMGRLIQTLEDEGELDNTIIFYFSDNGAASHAGDMMNTPYKGCKALLWEGGVKTHCIAYWHGVTEPGSVNNTIAWVGDLLPTCLDIVGNPYPKEFRGEKLSPLDGRSILSVLNGEEMAPPEYLLSNDKGQQGVIYKGKWKLLIEPGWYLQTSAEDGVNYELYDLEKDPAETVDLSQKHPGLVDQLSKVAEKWQSDCGIIDYGEILKIRPGHTK